MRTSVTTPITATPPITIHRTRETPDPVRARTMGKVTRAA
jgi:hypothetical protein